MKNTDLPSLFHVLVGVAILGALSGIIGCTNPGNDTPPSSSVRNLTFPYSPGGSSTILFTNRASLLEFKHDSRRLVFDNTTIWMNYPLSLTGGLWTVSQPDLSKIIRPLLDPSFALHPLDAKMIVLDPGHGGPDTGARSTSGLLEKALVLDLAERTKKRLVDKALQVRLTRNKDSVLGLSTRTGKAEKWKANIFISIHLNSAPNPRATGIETFVLTAPHSLSTAKNPLAGGIFPANRYDAASMVLAYEIHSRLVKRTRSADRGIRHARFEVLRSAPCPAILLECGFLSNKDDEGRLKNEHHRDALADAIAEGIEKYLELVGSAKNNR